jgi:lipoprotein-anchoring transpeptidase ErfK/SrfK
MKGLCSLVFIFLSIFSYSVYAERVFIFNPNKLTWSAYDDGELVGEGRASGGKNYCPDIRRACRTPVGTFRVYAKRGASCVSSIYPRNKRLPRARMPYCTFFHGGYAIHGSNHVPDYNASHGCIRVHPEDARWLQKNFLYIGTKVIVKPYHKRKRKK